MLQQRSLFLACAVLCSALHSAYAFAPLALSPVSVRSKQHASLSRLSMQSGPTGQKKADGTFDAKPFYARSDQMADLMACSFTSMLRLGTGALTSGFSLSLEKDDPAVYSAIRFGGYMLKEGSAVGSFNRPAQPLQLYEFESCPFCRKVREGVAILDLDVEFRPCPKEGTRYRPEVVERGGKAMFPFLVDPNTGKEMYESDDILQYLFEQYGDGRVPWQLRGGATLSAALGLLPRAGRGGRAGGGKKAAQRVEVWGYEGSPFSRVVREELSGLEVAHLWRSAARGSPKKQSLFQATGSAQLPYLSDPNTGVQMFESAAIIDYLRATYGPDGAA